MTISYVPASIGPEEQFIWLVLFACFSIAEVCKGQQKWGFVYLHHEVHEHIILSCSYSKTQHSL